MHERTTCTCMHACWCVCVLNDNNITLLLKWRSLSDMHALYACMLHTRSIYRRQAKYSHACMCMHTAGTLCHDPRSEHIWISFRSISFFFELDPFFCCILLLFFSLLHWHVFVCSCVCTYVYMLHAAVCMRARCRCYGVVMNRNDAVTNTHLFGTKYLYVHTYVRACINTYMCIRV